MRWLHLSDLHIGRVNQAQDVALNSILEAIEEFSDEKPFDVILLTGDLAFSGREQEYVKLVELLIAPLKKMTLARNADFIAVPGNHDLDCDRVLPTPWAGLDEDRRGRFFDLGPEGQALRDPRARGFGAYANFLSENRIKGVDPTADPAALIQVKRVSFLALVTAFFSDKKVRDKELTPAPLHAIRYLLSHSHQKGNALFILGHHPRSWFTRDTRDKFSGLLNKENALYLHGHEHRVRTEYGPKGLLALGFGAAYQIRSDVTPPRGYTNSFAICEFADSLHLKVVSWDAEGGDWRLESDLPIGFEFPSDRIAGGFAFALPSTKQSEPFAHGARALFQSKHSVSGCLWLAKDEKKAWQSILDVLGLFSSTDRAISSSDQLPPGHLQFRLMSSDGTHLIRAVSAQGDVFHEQTVQQLNTLFDTAAPASCLILTLGNISDEARSLLINLSKRKAINFRDCTQIGDALVTHLPSNVVSDLSEFDKSSVILTLLLLDDGVGVILKDRVRGEWFRVYDHKGRQLEEADNLVHILRQAQPELKGMRYHGSSTGSDQQATVVDASIEQFSADEYLASCQARFNDVQYAPLAALGFRFSNTTLTDLYVPANANLGKESRSDESLERAVTEFLDSLSLSANQREQLERQMRASHGLREGAEISAAQQLYQKHGNVVVTGDPGSGKTCFVKREIVAYCGKEGGEQGWYGQHLPVFVPLIEASQLLIVNDDILDICSLIAARSALSIPRQILNEYLSRGHLAIFFDGLDEISSLEDRIQILSRIRELIDRFGKLGNRFVLTSRPAALQPVNVPKELKHLRLSGLTEAEIRVLAMRVVTFRLVESTAGVDSSDAKELVDRLIEDCQGIPGIGRLARNPLLLTILVLVYANSGTLYAKRHVVYTQAIKTLVSVRNRPLKSKVISESDLRQRLGALGLAIYSRAIGEIPTRGEVLNVFAPYVSGESGDHKRASNEFLREVAEETGLLVIHKTGAEEDVISFMHHSFLEYYAAVGALNNGNLEELAQLSVISRWQDVITLLFGILSEHRDVTPLIQSIAVERTTADRITKKRLILAFDCALECDVPPEATQKLLAGLVSEAVKSGPARLSLPLRVDLGTRIGQLYSATGGNHIAELMTSGMSHANPSIAAAYVDICAHMNEDVRFEVGIEPFEGAFARGDTVLLLACASALRSRPEFRTGKALKCFKEGLSGNVLEKYTCLRTIESVGGLIKELWHEVVDMLGDSNVVVATYAARCLLTSGVLDHKKAEHRQTLERAVRTWQTTAEPPQRSLGSYQVEKEVILEMFESSRQETVLKGIHYLVLLQRDEGFVYENAMAFLRKSEDHQVRTACLQVLRNVPDALGLVTLADTEFLCSLLKAGERDVRISAARVLGELASDEQVYDALETNAGLAKNRRDVEEFNEFMEAIAQHAGSEDFASRRLEAVLGDMVSGFGDKTAQEMHRHSLRTLNELDVVFPYSSTRRLYALSQNYKAPKLLRKEALRAFGGLSEPSKEVLKLISKAVRARDRGLRHAAYEGSANFMVNCKKKIEFVRAVDELLPEFLEVLSHRWEVESLTVKDRIDDRAIAHLRKAIVEIEAILDSYAEFSERMRVGH